MIRTRTHSHPLVLPAVALALGVSLAGCALWRQPVDPGRVAGRDPDAVARAFASAEADEWSAAPRSVGRPWRVVEVSSLPTPSDAPDVVPILREYRVVLSRRAALLGSRLETDVVYVGVALDRTGGEWRVQSWGRAP